MKSSRPFIAEHSGRCVACDEEMQGAEVVFVDDELMHLRCAEDDGEIEVRYE